MDRAAWNDRRADDKSHRSVDLKSSADNDPQQLILLLKPPRGTVVAPQVTMLAAR